LRILFTILLLIFCSCFSNAQPTDSTAIKDSSAVTVPNTQRIAVLEKLNNILKENKFLNTQSAPVALYNTQSAPVALYEKPRKPLNEHTVFYILAGIFLFFGIIKSLFEKYYSTMFRVFFNSSLRQNQLTDQLMQSTVPALFFNILFVCTAALFTYFLLQKNMVPTFFFKKIWLFKINSTGCCFWDA